MKVLLDSNVVLDMLLARQPYLPEAEKIFALAGSHVISASISSNALTDIFYIARKYLQLSATKAALMDLMTVFEIISLSAAECQIALASSNPDFEDAVLEAYAQTVKMDYIITRDKDFLDRSNLTITPLDFLLKFKTAFSADDSI